MGFLVESVEKEDPTT